MWVLLVRKTFISLEFTKFVGSRTVALFKRRPSRIILSNFLSFLGTTSKLLQNKDGSLHSRIILYSFIWSKICLTWGRAAWGIGTYFWIRGFVSSIWISISMQLTLPISWSWVLKHGLCCRRIRAAVRLSTFERCWSWNKSSNLCSGYGSTFFNWSSVIVGASSIK